MSRLPFGRKRWLIKHATGFCGVGRRELLRGNQDHDECPRCGSSESSRHVLECTGTGAAQTFNLAATTFEVQLLSLNTAPSIIKALITRLHQWRKYGDHALPKFTTSDLWGAKQAVLDQDKIGWYSFLLGRMSTKWSDAQQRFLDSLLHRNTGRRWTCSVIQKALDVAWDMWEQRNDICHHTLHPRAAARVLAIQAQVSHLFQQGPLAFLLSDRSLFSKPEAILLKGTPSEMLQWICSVGNASDRVAAAKTASYQSLQPERALLERWVIHL
jgi:hypothetical protein